VDRIQGADPTSLENKIQQYYGSEDSEDGDNSYQGHVRSFESILYVLYTSIIVYITLFDTGFNIVMYNNSVRFTDGSVDIYPEATV
jgi:hypothetical protein